MFLDWHLTQVLWLHMISHREERPRQTTHPCSIKKTKGYKPHDLNIHPCRSHLIVFFRLISSRSGKCWQKHNKIAFQTAGACTSTMKVKQNTRCDIEQHQKKDDKINNMCIGDLIHLSEFLGLGCRTKHKQMAQG